MIRWTKRVRMANYKVLYLLLPRIAIVNTAVKKVNYLITACIMLTSTTLSYMNGLIIGRKKEIAILENRLRFQSAEFIAVYGRHRVGKTYLIKRFFIQYYCVIIFEQTGLNKGNLSEQA